MSIKIRPSLLTRREAGFTLIEVLVALLLVSFGLLGLAGLQSASLKVTQSSAFRSVASIRADEIAERMRTNYSGFGDGRYYAIWGAPGSLPPNGGCHAEYPGGTQTPPVSGCSSADMAKDDAFIWQAYNQISLPDGFGVVCRDSTPDDGTPAAPACSDDGSRVVIKVWWNESRIGGPVAQRFVTVFQP